jgi:hypothetical protein
VCSDQSSCRRSRAFSITMAAISNPSSTNHV